MQELALPTIPPGRWAVGVSGGADSVALLLLAHGRPGVSLHVVHLDHETRDGASAEDAAFVVELARQLGRPVTVARRSELERDPPRNPSARYRAARLALFRRVVAEHQLDGILLAHHADDQAETVMLRILRGGGARAVVGMAERATLIAHASEPCGSAAGSSARVEEPAAEPPGPGVNTGVLVILRPLLRIASADLRQFLRHRRQPWREDASNASDRFLRNRVRPWLAGEGRLADAIRRLAGRARDVQDWLDGRAPVLGDRFAVGDLTALSAPVARHAAGAWLLAHGVPADRISRTTCDCLVAMATDAATPHRQSFPGAVSVRRSHGWMAVASPPSPPGR